MRKKDIITGFLGNNGYLLKSFLKSNLIKKNLDYSRKLSIIITVINIIKIM